MSTKKKGLLTVSKEWARHLRPFGRRQFWSAERMAVRQAMTSEINWIDANMTSSTIRTIRKLPTPESC